jgi:hypothetical protein
VAPPLEFSKMTEPHELVSFIQEQPAAVVGAPACYWTIP